MSESAAGSDLMPRFSVVVPVRDEAETIGPFLRALRAALPPGHEVLICHDDDADPTLPALAALPPAELPDGLRLVRNPGAPGPRQAIETGMKAARAPVVVVMMADLSDDLPQVGRLVELVEAGAAVACASRYAPGGRQVGGPWLKGMMSRVAGHLLHQLSGLPTTDPTNSFKAYSRAFLERTPIESRAGFSLALELTVKAHLAGERVAELPATWHDRRGGASKFRLLRWLPGYLFWFLWGLQALLLRRAPTARPRLWRSLAAVGLLGLVWLTWLDLPFEVATDTLDPSWRQALGRAFAARLRLGDELLFTGGPLGFLATPSFDRELWAMRHLWALVWATVATLITARLLSRLPSPAWRLALVGLLLLAPPDLYLFPLLVAALLVLAAEAPGRSRRVTTFAAFAVLATALATLRLALLGHAVALVALVAARSLAERAWREAGRVALAATGTWLLLWLLAGQPLGALPVYLPLAGELIAGYGAAMSMTSPQGEWRFALGALALLGVSAVLWSRTTGGWRRGAWPLAALAVALAVAFRHGFARQDDVHMAPFFALAATLALALPGCFAAAAPQAAPGGGGARRSRLATAASLTALVLALVLLARVQAPAAARIETRLRQLAASVAGVVRPLMLRDELTARAAALRETHALDRLAARIGGEPVDLLTVQQGVLFLNRLDWRPRPVFQSYAAYTPRLAELNRRHLAGPRAPEWLLVRWSSIDGRLPALEDGPALLELLARYRPVDEEKGWLLMRLVHRAATPESARVGPELWRGTFRLDEPLVLDGHGDGPKALTLRLSPTHWGRFRGALLGAPELAAELTGDDGRTAIVRIVPAMAESPFLIDPLARRDRDLDHLLRGGELPGPVSLRFLLTPRARAFYRDEVEATLYALPALAPSAPLDGG